MSTHSISIKAKALNCFVLFAGALICGSLVVLSGGQPAKAAACQAPSKNYGSVDATVTIPATATYRVWSRIMTPNTTNNTYLLEVDGTNCFSVGGGSVPANSWTWIAYKNGSATTYIDISLTQGAHTLKLIGDKADVKLDRLVLAADLNCVPNGNGNNCDTPADTTPPVVNLTAPASGSSISGTTTINATATDNTVVSKVEFYVNSSLIGTDTSAPYAASWSTTATPNGVATLTVKAYDSVGNVSSDGHTVTVQNGDTQAPTTPANVTAAAPAYNKVKLAWQPSTDNVGVSGYVISRNGTPLIQVAAVTSYEDTTVAAHTTYTYQVAALDAAGNKSTASAPVSITTPALPDTQAPTAPTNVAAVTVSSTQINLSWQPSSDNSGAVNYDVYRAPSNNMNNFQKIATVATTSFGNTGLKPATEYAYFVKARDASGNTSAASNTAIAKTNAKKRTGTIWGVVTDSSGKRISGATVSTTVEGTDYTFKTNSQGAYSFNNLPAARYSIAYKVAGFKSKSTSVQLNEGATKRKDITLTRR